MQQGNWSHHVWAMAAALSLLLSPVVSSMPIKQTVRVVTASAVDAAAHCSPQYMLLPITSSDSPVQRQREVMVVKLSELGYEPADAMHMAMQLTPADLDVLLANQRMLQPAAGMSQTSTAVIIGVVIVAAVVVLVIAGDSSSVHVGGGM